MPAAVGPGGGPPRFRGREALLAAGAAILLIVLIWAEVRSPGAPEPPAPGTGGGSPGAVEGAGAPPHPRVEGAVLPPVQPPPAPPRDGPSPPPSEGREGTPEALEHILADIGLDLHVDAAGKPVPMPPPEYRGSPFHWRLKFPVEEEHLSGLLRNLRPLSPMERTSVLQNVRWGGSPLHGRILLEEVGRVPDSPGILFGVASALLATAKGVLALEAGRPSAHPVSGILIRTDAGLRPIRERTALPPDAPSARELAEAALSLLARKVARYGDVMNDAEWGGIHSLLESAFKTSPEAVRGDPAARSLGTIRRGLLTALGKVIGRGQGGYLGGEPCFRLAAFLAGRRWVDDAKDSRPATTVPGPTAFLAGTEGSEEIHALFLDILRSWDVAHRRLGHDGPRAMAAWFIYQSLLAPPCERHAGEGALLLAGVCRSTETGAVVAAKLRGPVASARNLPPEIRNVLDAALGILPDRNR